MWMSKRFLFRSPCICSTMRPTKLCFKLKAFYFVCGKFRINTMPYFSPNGLIFTKLEHFSRPLVYAVLQAAIIRCSVFGFDFPISMKMSWIHKHTYIFSIGVGKWDGQRERKWAKKMIATVYDQPYNFVDCLHFNG